MERFLPFVHEKWFYNPTTDVVPGEDLVVVPLAVHIKGPINPRLLKCINPFLKVEVFFPCIKLTSILPGLLDDLPYPSVASCKNTFQNTALCIVKFDMNAFATDSIKQSVSDLFYSLKGNHRMPLKGGMCLGYKRRNADIHLSKIAADALFQVRNMIGKSCNGIDVVVRLSGKSDHKIELY